MRSGSKEALVGRPNIVISVSWRSYRSVLLTILRSFLRRDLSLRSCQPAFLDDPEMLNKPSYPGLHGDVEGGQTLLISRAGFASFSTRQPEDRSNIYLVNGARNVIAISPRYLPMQPVM